MSDTVTFKKSTIRATAVALSIFAVGTWIEVKAAEAIGGPTSIEVVQEMQNGAKNQTIQYVNEFDFSLKEKYDFEELDRSAIQRNPINHSAFEDKLTKLNIDFRYYSGDKNHKNEYLIVKNEIEKINLQYHDPLSTYILKSAEALDLQEKCRGSLYCYNQNRHIYISALSGLESIVHLDKYTKVSSCISSLKEAYYRTLTQDEDYKHAALDKFKQS